MSLSMTTTDYVVMVIVIPIILFALVYIPLRVDSQEVRRSREARSALLAEARRSQIAGEPAGHAEQPSLRTD